MLTTAIVASTSTTTPSTSTVDGQTTGVGTTTNTVATVFANVADAVYQGIDLELQVVPTDWLNLFASFGWLDAEYRDFFTDINPNDTASTTLVDCND